MDLAGIEPEYLNIFPKELLNESPVAVSQDLPVRNSVVFSNLIEKASSTYALGNLESALSIYDNLISIDSTNNVLFANRSAILLKLERVEEAVKEADKAILLKPEWSKAHFRKAEALKRCGQIDEALLCFAKALQLSPTVNQFQLAFTNCVLISAIGDEFSDALHTIQLMGYESNSFVLISIAGQEFLNKAEHCSMALELLTLAAKIDAPSLQLKSSTLGALAKANFQLGHVQGAIDQMIVQLEVTEELKQVQMQTDLHANIARLALELNPHNSQLAVLHLTKRIDLMEQSNPREAISYFTRAESFASGLEELLNATLFKCKCLLADKKVTKALDMLKQTLDIHQHTLKKMPEILGQFLGEVSACYLELGNLTAARKYASRELKISLEIGTDLHLRAQALHLLANIFAGHKDWKNAIRLADKLNGLIEENKHFLAFYMAWKTNALTQLGDLHLRAEDFNRAEEMFIQKLDLTRNAAEMLETHCNLAKVYAALNKQDKRKKHIDQESKILEQNPSLGLQYELIWLEDMAYFYLDQQDYDEAITNLEKCLMIVQEMENCDKEAVICEKLGMINAEIGLEEDAIVYFSQFLSINQQRRDIDGILRGYSELAKIHCKLEEWAEALECFKYELTLAKIVNKTPQRLEAMLSIGRIVFKQENIPTAAKIL
uniref:Tetratricopeptide repeat protein n=1 Tax=Ditylenchus dipsaci TaxID=166011 RepID=A0A915CPM2_9BILA